MPIGQKPIDISSGPRRILPSGVSETQLTLLSSMQVPREAIKKSEWATRGWTYQEGVLSNRRLVFTEEQVYWECRGMAVCESINIDLNVVHRPSGKGMEDFMLSGIFDDDLHRNEELQYGFKLLTQHDIGDRVVTLDGHIQAYTSRRLTVGRDFLKALMGVAASYATNDGLSLLLGMPVWVGTFANNEPGLQHTFALSISSWTRVAEPIHGETNMFVRECARRSQFPSWTWAGWEGRVEFCNQKQSITHRTEGTNGMVGVITMLPGPERTDPGGHFETAAVDPSHSNFFKALTSRDWVTGMEKIWSTEMMLHDEHNMQITVLTDWASVRTIDPNIKWLLTLREPLVLRHIQLKHSTREAAWRLEGNRVTVHLSVPITEARLVTDHASGHLMSVLVFASIIPYVYLGIARYLILRKAEDGTKWERIGRINMWISEAELERYRVSEAMTAALPVESFAEVITIV